ncbi:MAG: hypothetical protein RIQ47_657 [Bacteroidota bacterium]|jgi:hypothetical protein
MINSVKNFLKKHLLIFRVWDKFSPAAQAAQRQLFLYYQERVASGNPPALTDTGLKVFSQHEEDGLLLFIFSTIGMGGKRFVEIGSNDGVNSNCANLVLNFGWYGLFIDGDKTAVERGEKFYKRYPDPWAYHPKFLCTKVTRENVNQLIGDAGFQGEIDLLSIDLDGYDYWIWDALEVVAPRVVIIETHVEFGLNNIVVPYDANYSFPGKHPVYHGASPVAMTRMAKRKGYRLVGANEYGHNLIFIKDSLNVDLIPEVRVETLLTHPSATESFKDFEPIKDWEYLEG